MNSRSKDSLKWLQQKITAVEEAPSEDFLDLIRVAELDPRKHLKYADWSGINFKNNDLRDFDFSGANLRNCVFDNAQIAGARFDKADLRGSNLRKAADWNDYQKGWTPPPNTISDDCLSSFSVFQDAPFAPEMISIPPGTFEMGSSKEEEQWLSRETPKHTVTIPHPFAVGRFTVTVEEWNLSSKNKSARKNAKDNKLPVTDINWLEAREYCNWLSQKTEHSYRLLTEAEWEYVTRAGTNTSYWLGNSISPKDANYNKKKKSILSVDSFEPNPWGLYNTHGNVFEWVEDQYFSSYDGAPENGQAWVENEVADDEEVFRVIRGGARFSAPQHVRSASRFRRPAGERNQNIGFRVARTLNSREETDL